MAQKTGRSFMPTLLVVTVVAGALFVLPKVLHQSDMVLLQVTWSPFPRKIRVEHAIGTGDTMKDDPTKGMWERLVPAKPGTVIYLAAFQDAPGTLACRVTRGGQELSHDTNAGRKEISLVNAVKCISGG